MSNKKFTTESGRTIYKEPVIAWAIARSEGPSGSDEDYLSYRPIVAQVAVSPPRQPFDNTAMVLEDDEVEGVVPASDGTFKVYAPMGEHGGWEEIGFELPGASNPDWDNMIDRHDLEYNDPQED
jgi:hypothetical protein